MKGIIIINHGSRNSLAKEHFLNKVAELKKRLLGKVVEGAFFSLGSPKVEEVVFELYKRGIKKIGWYPYFLNPGNHVLKDLPRLKQEIEDKFKVEIEILPGLYEEPFLDELVFESIKGFWAQDYLDFTNPEEIEKTSLDFIESKLTYLSVTREEKEVIKRVIHATCDFSFAKSLCFHPKAIHRALSLLEEKRAVFCDVNMIKAGLGNKEQVFCAISDKKVKELAKEQALTRAAAAFRQWGKDLHNNIVLIGNAPTALEEILNLAHYSNIKPGLVIGVPVGFVGASLVKEKLRKSDLVYITNRGPRGGSPVAVATFNALKKLKRNR